ANLLVACGGSDASSNESNTQSQLPQTTEEATADNTIDSSIVARVNGVPISRAVFEAELAAVSNNFNDAASDSALQETVLSSLIDQILIEQYAAENNIIITDEELENELKSLSTLAETSGFTLAQVLGLPPNADSSVVAQKVYQGLLAQAVADDVVSKTELITTQVHARHILVREEALARELLERLQNGEDFATLAATYSIDATTAPAGGDLGWIVRGDLLLDTVEEIIFNMPANTRYPEPVPSDLGWHIIEVLERDETQSLTDEQISQQRILIYQKWLADQRRTAVIERFTN
ncbi:MAG: hypothetical protein CUN55_10675, partial [Phototrophicales bacterium]